MHVYKFCHVRRHRVCTESQKLWVKSNRWNSHKHKSQTEDLKVYGIHIFCLVISTLASLNLLIVIGLTFFCFVPISLSCVLQRSLDILNPWYNQTLSVIFTTFLFFIYIHFVTCSNNGLTQNYTSKIKSNYK